MRLFNSLKHFLLEPKGNGDNRPSNSVCLSFVTYYRRGIYARLFHFYLFPRAVWDCYTHSLAEALSSSERPLEVTILAEELSREQPGSSFQVASVFTREGDYPEQVIKHVKTLAPDIIHIQHEYGIFGLDDRFFRLLVQLRDLAVRTVVTLHGAVIRCGGGSEAIPAEHRARRAVE